MAKLNSDWVVQHHGDLQRVSQGIWTVKGSIGMPLGRFPRRMTVNKLANGDLAVWSAIALAEPQMEALDALGPVRFLIVPNAGHRLDVRAWLARYPGATVIAPPGAREAVAEAVPVDAVNDSPLADPEVSLSVVQGMKADEFAMTVSRADGTTLVLNDVLASVSHPTGLGAHIMARLFGFGVKRPQVSRLVRKRYVSDAKAVARQLYAWAELPDLKRVIVSHVDVLGREPRGRLLRAADDL
jgi:hypothetical protein